jgi:hypothetical protein
LYATGMIVRFQAGFPIPPSILVSGWSTRENWGVWSDGPEARLTLDSKPGLLNTEDLLLIFRVSAFVSPRHPRQLVDVLVNDSPLALWTFESGGATLERRVRIPPAVVEFPLIVTFRLHNPVSPAELGGSADSRRLGIGLISLHVVNDGKEH